MKRKLFAWILALTMVFSLAACGGSGKNADSSSMAVADSAPSETEKGYFDTTDSDDASADSGSTVLKDQKIIYTGTLNLETTEFDAAAKALPELAESLGAIWKAVPLAAAAGATAGQTIRCGCHRLSFRAFWIRPGDWRM